MKILIKGGRVMDPAGGFDQRCDLALADAKIVAIKDIGADFHEVRGRQSGGPPGKTDHRMAQGQGVLRHGKPNPARMADNQIGPFH